MYLNIDAVSLIWEQDQQKRSEYIKSLAEETQSGLTVNDAACWKNLLNKRIVVKKNVTIDLFLKFWLDMLFLFDRCKSSFGINSARKEILENLQSEELSKIISESPHGRLFYEIEMKNALMLYCRTALQDKNFGSTFFGIKKADNDFILMKLEKQMETLSTALPERVGLQTEMAHISKIVNESYAIFEDKFASFSGFM